MREIVGLSSDDEDALKTQQAQGRKDASSLEGGQQRCVGEAPATQEEESKWQEQVREEGDKMTVLLNMHCGCILIACCIF